MARAKSSPQLVAPFEGTPIIRISVYHRATSHEGKNASGIGSTDEARAALPAPQYLKPGAKYDYAGDVPQRVIGFRQPTLWPGTNTPCSGGFEVVNCRITHTRAWACSSATFTIAAPLSIDSPAPEPPIRIEDVVTIELGYAPSMRASLSHPRVFFFPRFYGIVDDVKERGGSGGERDGVVFTIVARDPIRYLVDNKIRGAYLEPKDESRDNRGYLIMDLMWLGSQIEPIKWKTNAKGQREPDTVDGKIQMAPYGPDNSYVRVGRIEASQRAKIEPPFDNTGAQGIPILDRTPMDIIKHFSLVEAYPREVWAEPDSGKVSWMCRRTDMTMLLNPETRARRQYFYRYPTNKCNVIAYTNEWTSAGTKSHFVITNGRAHAESVTGAVEVAAYSPFAQLEDPHMKKGVAGWLLRRFTRQAFIYDDTLVQGDSSETEMLAHSLSAVWGKDIQTGMVHVPGDPTLNIGEAVQLFNMGLFGRRLNPVYNKAGKVTKWEQSGPEGIFRIEGLQELYASGGTKHGYTTVFMFNFLDPESRQIRSADQWMPVLFDYNNPSEPKNRIKLLDVAPPPDQIWSDDPKPQYQSIDLKDQ